MAERNYYVLCDNNCKFPAMTKEQILAAIEQAITTGEITDVDTGFVTKIKELKANKALTFWVGTQAEYNAITEYAENCFYIITDETTEDDVYTAIAEMRKDIDAMFEAICPPMNELVEYQTTERFLGKPVFAKIVRLTTATVGNYENKTIYSGNSDQDIYIVSIDGVIYDEKTNKTFALPMIDTDNGSVAATLSVEATQDAYGWLWNAKVKTIATAAQQCPVEIIVKYTKAQG